MSETMSSAATADLIQQRAEPIARLMRRVHETVIGQDEMVRGLVIGLLTGGHVLLEGVPGLAKTLAISTLARSVDAAFKRIQFTPDLLPADLIGTQVYNPRDGTFSARKGPIFANFVLADEINRAPAKVQSALLEAMQERRVTIGDETYSLPDPFLVLATQNPIEQEGTYPLPEAQVDRFMLKITVGYPSKEQERRIVDAMAKANAKTVSASASASARSSGEPAAVIDPKDILAARTLVDAVHLDDRIRDYIVELVHATRTPDALGLGMNLNAGRSPGRSAAGRSRDRLASRENTNGHNHSDNSAARYGEPESERLIQFGGSPRASISLALASKAAAFLDGRAYVTPHDVKSVANSVLRHRVILSYEAEAQDLTSDVVVRWILDHVPVP